jgi:hypothetical protein
MTVFFWDILPKLLNGFENICSPYFRHVSVPGLAKGRKAIQTVTKPWEGSN